MTPEELQRTANQLFYGDKNRRKPMNKLAYTALYFIVSMVILTTLYLASLGWPVLKYNLATKWMGATPAEVVEVIKFNRGREPLPMEEEDGTVPDSKP